MAKGKTEKRPNVKKHCSQSSGTRSATVLVEDDLVQKAKDRIDKVMSDTSCSVDETKERLEDIRDHVQTCIEAL